MPKIILRDQIVEDDWVVVRFPVKDGPVRKAAGKPVLFKVTGEPAAADEEIAALQIPDGKVIIPAAIWHARKNEFAPRLSSGTLSVWLDSFESPEALVESVGDVNSLPLIGINFPRFVDGRGFSFAALLRTRYGYKGQLRAIGDVLKDQLFYMKRCGFDAFAVREDKNIEDALRGLNDFSETYQSAVDQPLPIYRRHVRSAAM